MHVRIEFLDPGNASSDLYGGFDFVLGMSGGFIDQGGAEERSWM